MPIRGDTVKISLGITTYCLRIAFRMRQSRNNAAIAIARFRNYYVLERGEDEDRGEISIARREEFCEERLRAPLSESFSPAANGAYRDNNSGGNNSECN